MYFSSLFSRWTIPNGLAKKSGRVSTPRPSTRNLSLGGGTSLKVVEQNLKVSRSTEDDQGNYVCTVKDHSGNVKTKKHFVRVFKKDENFLRISTGAYQQLSLNEENDNQPVQWVVQIESHPEPTVIW